MCLFASFFEGIFHPWTCFSLDHQQSFLPRPSATRVVNLYSALDDPLSTIKEEEEEREAEEGEGEDKEEEDADGNGLDRLMISQPESCHVHRHCKT